MKRPQLVPQGSLNRILQASEQAWNNRDFQQAIEQLERATRLAPANCQILLQLGRVYGLRCDYASAERCFEKAIRVGSQTPELLAAVASYTTDFANHEMAERYFRRCTEREDAEPETIVRLAELYERLHRVDEASHLVDRALRLDSNNPVTLLARARLDRQGGDLEKAEKLLQLLIKQGDREIRVRAHHELGMMLDRQGRYDDAMAAFLEAKALLRPDAAPLVEHLGKKHLRLTDLRGNISAEMLERWSGAGEGLQPRRQFALLCGHPRSGTTLLEQVLDSHPGIVSAEETTIFHDEAYVPLRRGFPEGTARMLPVLESAQVNALQQSRERYFTSIDRWIGGPVGDRLLIDKNPSLTVMIPAVIRIFPEAKFLVALRDPRDVCLSCFMQLLLPMTEVASAYLTIEDTMKEYAAVMSMWTTLAPLMKNTWTEVRYEDMVEDLESVSRRVIDFLQVPWTSEVLKFHEHAQKKLVRSPTYADVAKPIFKRAVGRWRNYQKYLEPHLAIIEPFVKAFGYDV